MDKAKILLVEDDLNLGFLLTEFLEEEGFEVKLCKDGEMGLHAFQRSTYQLCILDVMMPGMDGFTLAKQLKTINPDTPFLFVTAKSLKADRMIGYACGAEDYVIKPFDEEELLWKIRVILRRNSLPVHETKPSNQFQIGQYLFDYEMQELRFQDQAVRVTEKENEILRLLCLNKNRILRRDDAVEQVYGKKDYFLGRSFDVFISRIRKLLQQDETVSIDNVYKVGFILKTVE